MESGKILQSRYKILKKIGEGGMGTTFLSTDLIRKDLVVLKYLSITRSKDWKSIELFEREAKILKSINHPFIPDYKDYFEYKENDNAYFVLVQEYVEGENLQQKVENGFRCSEDEIKKIAIKLLSIIKHIHSLRPPIIHRDINPKNIILRDDGEIYIVDFGGVQEAIKSEAYSGSTVIGTAGYSPIEQYQGRAVEESDLYAFACTILFLLTHKDPSSLPAKNLKIDLSSFSFLSEELKYVLNIYLEPEVFRRDLPIERAINILDGSEALSREIKYHPVSEDDEDYRPASKPEGTNIEVTEDYSKVEITIPGRMNLMSMILLGFSAVWLMFISIWTISTISDKVPVFFPLFSLPFWGVGIFLVYMALFRLYGKFIIQITRNKKLFYIKKLFSFERKGSASLDSVGKCYISSVNTKSSQQMTQCSLDVGYKRIKFGDFLTDVEKNWVRKLINYYVKKYGR